MLPNDNFIRQARLWHMVPSREIHFLWPVVHTKCTTPPPHPTWNCYDSVHARCAHQAGTHHNEYQTSTSRSCSSQSVCRYMHLFPGLILVSWFRPRGCVTVAFIIANVDNLLTSTAFRGVLCRPTDLLLYWISKHVSIDHLSDHARNIKNCSWLQADWKPETLLRQECLIRACVVNIC